MSDSWDSELEWTGLRLVRGDNAVNIMYVQPVLQKCVSALYGLLVWNSPGEVHPRR